MTEPLTPPYPADTAAKGWRFEVAMEKVRQSDTWSLTLLRGYEPKALLIWMWSVAWEQTPCGSFPNDETLIASRLELPPKVWAKHRDILMRNWWLASDGRLYHDTITQRVLAMLDKRANDAQRAATRRARNAESPKTPKVVTPASRVTPPEPTREFDTKHQAPSTKKSKPPHPPAGGADGFDQFWEAWPTHPRKVAQKQCRAKWAIEACEPIAEQVVAHVEAMKSSRAWLKDGGEFIPAPMAYLNQRRWEAGMPDAPSLTVAASETVEQYTARRAAERAAEEAERLELVSPQAKAARDAVLARIQQKAAA